MFYKLVISSLESMSLKNWYINATS